MGCWEMSIACTICPREATGTFHGYPVCEEHGRLSSGEFAGLLPVSAGSAEYKVRLRLAGVRVSDAGLAGLARLFEGCR